MTSRRAFLLGAAARFATAPLAQGKIPFTNPFFAMDTAMVSAGGTLLQHSDVEILAALRYSGMGAAAGDPVSWRHLTQMVLPWLESKKLQLFAAYSWARIGREKFEIDPGIKRFGAALSGHKAVIWLPLSSTEFKPSDPNGDAMAVEAVREAADNASKGGCTVSLYPHFGSLIQTIADAVRIADKTGLPDVRVTFNLCHWLRAEGPSSMGRVLKLALPRLSLVTLNGADSGGKDWNQLIQPLDRGNFDLKTLLRELQSLNYHGPIGLQGYDVAKNFHVEPVENLKRSMVAWRNLIASL